MDEHLQAAIRQEGSGVGGWEDFQIGLEGPGAGLVSFMARQLVAWCYLEKGLTFRRCCEFNILIGLKCLASFIRIAAGTAALRQVGHPEATRSNHLGRNATRSFHAPSLG